MRIHELAHILRAAKALTDEVIFTIVGSQAFLAQFPTVETFPEEMVRSNEIDIWPTERPDLSDIIEGALGNGSSFHEHYGYHADGVSPETPTLPANWETRAIRLEGHPSMDGAVAICPEIHDLAASKIAAHRQKDLEWVDAGIRARLICPETLLERIMEIEIGSVYTEDHARISLAWATSRIDDHDLSGPR